MSGGRLWPLVPFATTPGLARLQLEGRAERRGPELRLSYHLRGPLAQLAIPAESAAPERRDGLWQATCFEAFWAEAGQEPYWELNLSPAGHWNLYRLNGYRQGLAPEAAVARPAWTLERDATALDLALSVPLPPGLPAGAPLQLALTAVLQERTGRLSYWALAHPGAEADFHRRDGFLVEL